MLNYIQVLKDILPYSFNIQISNITYNMQINYNSEGDFFTFDIYQDETPLALGLKVVLDTLLYSFGDVVLYVTAITEGIDKVTFDNINVDTFIALIEV